MNSIIGMKKSLLVLALFASFGCSEKKVTPLWVEYDS
jgi:hypothetical protein